MEATVLLVLGIFIGSLLGNALAHFVLIPFLEKVFPPSKEVGDVIIRFDYKEEAETEEIKDDSLEEEVLQQRVREAFEDSDRYNKVFRPDLSKPKKMSEEEREKFLADHHEKHREAINKMLADGRPDTMSDEEFEKLKKFFDPTPCEASPEDEEDFQLLKKAAMEAAHKANQEEMRELLEEVEEDADSAMPVDDADVEEGVVEEEAEFQEPIEDVVSQIKALISQDEELVQARQEVNTKLMALLEPELWNGKELEKMYRAIDLLHKKIPASESNKDGTPIRPEDASPWILVTTLKELIAERQKRAEEASKRYTEQKAQRQKKDMEEALKARQDGQADEKTEGEEE